MPRILCSRTRFAVPFMFDEKTATFDELAEQMTKVNGWKIGSIKAEGIEQDLYELIHDSFVQKSNQSNIGLSFDYHNNGKPLLEFIYTHSSVELKVSITTLGMFLFRTNVGILWYEIEMPDEVSVEDMILFQNEFKELTYESFVRPRKPSQRCAFENVQDGSGILLGHWIVTKFFNKFPFDYTFFAARDDCLGGEKIPDKALTFNYAVFSDISSEEYMDYIYWITNGYNRRYKRNALLADQLYSPFHNAYGYATTVGCGYYAIPEGTNSNFYLRTMKKKIMTDYYNLFILAIYQSYSILRYTKLIERDLSAESRTYMEESQMTLQKLKEVTTEINLFLIKSIYTSISHIDHQNGFYQYLVARLKIKENIASLTVGLEALSKLQEMREKERISELERQENEQREKADAKMDLSLAVISVFMLISAISDSAGVAAVLRELFGFSASVQVIIEWIILGLVILIAFWSLRMIFFIKK